MLFPYLALTRSTPSSVGCESSGPRAEQPLQGCREGQVHVSERTQLGASRFLFFFPTEPIDLLYVKDPQYTHAPFSGDEGYRLSLLLSYKRRLWKCLCL